MPNSEEKNHSFRIVGSATPEMVSIQARDLFPLLADAVDRKRVFLEDFGDDLIKVSRDLYEVLISHQRCLRDEAA